jgi:hypothetical protein
LYKTPFVPACVLIATVDVQRVGRRLGFANCYLHCAERRIVRASAVAAAR